MVLTYRPKVTLQNDVVWAYNKSNTMDEPKRVLIYYTLKKKNRAHRPNSWQNIEPQYVFFFWIDKEPIMLGPKLDFLLCDPKLMNFFTTDSRADYVSSSI